MIDKHSNGVDAALAADLEHAYFTIVGILMMAVADSVLLATLAAFATIGVRALWRKYRRKKQSKTFVGGIDQDGRWV